jgi:hypothetical protein
MGKVNVHEEYADNVGLLENHSWEPHTLCSNYDMFSVYCNKDEQEQHIHNESGLDTIGESDIYRVFFVAAMLGRYDLFRRDRIHHVRTAG